MELSWNPKISSWLFITFLESKLLILEQFQKKKPKKKQAS